MAEEKKILTQSGYDKLSNELEDLKVNRCKEVAEKIKEARAQGDLSENAEYDAALAEQRDIEARISEIENILKHSRVIEEHPEDGRVSIGSRVTIQEIGEDFEEVYEVVGTSEANSLEGRISNESPVGSALMGKMVGETVTIETAVGEVCYKVLKVEHSAA